jgi:hypothetical protein
MATRQVLETAADEDLAPLQQFIGIGELHILFCQEWAKMFVALLQRRVLECFIGARLRFSGSDFV